MIHQLKYVQAPLSELSAYLGLANCSYCNSQKECFGTGYADGNHDTICLDCLAKGKNGYSHVTEIGYLDKSGFRDLNFDLINSNSLPILQNLVDELAKTPRLLVYQEENWLVHCHDFMIYLGHWDYIDFFTHSPSGDGQALFEEMTDKPMSLWRDISSSMKENGITLDAAKKLKIFESLNISYHAFQCGHCAKLRGTWDMD